MRKKIALYILFVLLFEICRFFFLVYHSDVYSGYAMGEWMSAMWHGLPHDLTTAGYLMALPFVLQLVCIWIPGKWHTAFMRFWIRLTLALVLIIVMSDMELYRYWGFRIDNTALFYLLDSPGEALGQVAWWMLLGALVLFVLIWWALQRLLCKFYPGRTRGAALCMLSSKERSWHTGVAVLLCGLVFLAIRGGVTPATMNVGRVYFSSEMPLNHAATNPVFSFIYSMSHKKKDFSKQYRFMSAEEAVAAYAELGVKSEEGRVKNEEGRVKSEELGSEPMACAKRSLSNEAVSDSSLFPLPSSLSSLHSSLLKTQRPNIVLLILESFAGAACTGVYAEADSTILPNVNRMYREGIGFSNVFANSFRTDRGCASILAGYPAQPTYSVMKDQKRSNHLQHLGQRLKENGYKLGFVHGGDVNFTNMRGFLTAGGFEQIVGDENFPVSDRLSKWGVPDHMMFNYLFDEVTKENQEPFVKVMLTLSSHEPFDVEYHHFENEYVNSIAYADSCLGSFIDRLKQTPAWDSLLIIGVADHAFARYPEGIQNHEILRYRIPMFWTGGAIASPQVIDTYGSQTDLAATLLNQMGIECADFNFSKDLMCDSIGHYGFYTFSDGFGFVTDSCAYIQDNARSGQGLSGTNDPEGKAERWGKAYLQTLYDDLNKR